MVSVGIEVAVRPICGKGRARADNRMTFPLLFLLIMVVMEERVLPYIMHESRTRIIYSGMVVGHHCHRSQLTVKLLQGPLFLP